MRFSAARLFVESDLRGGQQTCKFPAAASATTTLLAARYRHRLGADACTATEYYGIIR
jgi:hypothetical protein